MDPPSLRGRRKSSVGSELGRWLVGVGVVAVLAAIGVHALLTHQPIWTVQHLETSGNRSVGEDALLAALDLELGMPWWRACARLGDVDELSEVDPDARVERIRVRLSFPPGIQVTVDERETVFLIPGDPTRVLASDGIVMAPDPELDPTDLPCLTGASGAPLGQELVIADAASWQAQLETVRRRWPDLWSRISQVEVADARAIRIYFRDAHRVILWDPHLNAQLWDQVPGVLQELEVRGLAADAVLDMRFRDQIVVRVPEALLPATDPDDDLGQTEADVSEATCRRGGRV